MRSFGSLALKQVRSRRLRALLTAAGIVLGVGMVFAVLALSATIRGTFRDLFDSVYGRTDLVVSGSEGTGSLPQRELRLVERTPGVSEAVGDVTGVWTLVGKDGKASDSQSDQLNVGGFEPREPDLSSAETIEGRDPRRGRETTLQQSWADDHGLRVGDRVPLATPSGISLFRVVGLFQFSTGLEFGGQGFSFVPLSTARRLMDKRHVYDEIEVIASGTGQDAVSRLRGRLRARLGGGVEVSTPESRSADIENQLQSFDVILFFFAGMALFVGGFLIFNSFTMTVLQRMREIGMVRTLGATRGMVAGTVLREAILLCLAGIALGLGLGVLLAKALVAFVAAIGFPVGKLKLPPSAALIAVATGLVTTVVGALYPARRAGGVPPIRAILGAGEVRERPGARRAAVGLVLIALGGAGCFNLASSSDSGTLVVAGGIVGVIALFMGIAALAPFAIVPLVGALSLPLRALGIEGRLAADTVSATPKRTAATATALTVGLALVVALGTIGSSFLSTISDEFDRAFARDLTVQPRGLAPGQGPQQTIAPGVRDRIARLPGAGVVARERFHFVPELPAPPGERGSDGLLVGFNPAQYRQVDRTEPEGVSRDQMFRRLEHGQVTVGEGYADDHHLRVGDTVVLRGPSGTRRTRVAGIVKTVVFGGDTSGMSLRTMREVYGITADSELAVTAASPADRGPLRQAIERVVEVDYPNLTVLSNDELKGNIEDMVNQQFGFFNAILGVAVIVSLFGIINTLTMSVLERTREIGVLRALGSTRWQVRRTIVDESLVIALIGAVIGIVVGAALGFVILKGIASLVPGAGYQPPWVTIGAVALAGVVLGLVASILPARRAARLDVIDALSYE